MNGWKVFVGGAGCGLAAIGLAQLPGLGGGSLPGIDSLFKQDPPITTALGDAVTELPYLDPFSPTGAIDMSVLKKDGAAFKLAPGQYTFEAQSYCLRAGTHGPGSGEGYLYAPLKGPKNAIVRNILLRSNEHLSIPQNEIQVLIWAILARAKPSQMKGQVRETANALMTPAEFASLESGGLDFLQSDVTNRLFGGVSNVLRPIYEAENRIRRAVSMADQPFEELERVAVLTGEYTPRRGDREVPRGRWCYHPDGYFVRYFPHGYSHTTVGVYVPEPLQYERDAAKRIVSISDGAGRKLSIEDGQLKFGVKWDTLRNVAHTVSKPDSDKRKKDFEALAKKLKKPTVLAGDLAAIADMIASLQSADAEWKNESLEFAYHAWMSALSLGASGVDPTVQLLLQGPGGSSSMKYDPSSSVATPGQTGRQRLAQSSRCRPPHSDSAEMDEFRKAVVDAMRKKGYQVGPENVHVYDQRNSGGLLRFVVRMGHNNNPLPTMHCIEEKIARGEVPPGSLEGAKELMFGSVQTAGSLNRVGVRTVNVETGVITGAGKGDGESLANSTDNAVQDYRRW